MVRMRRGQVGRHRDEDGAMAVIVAISAVMIFVLAAMIVDLGLARDTRRQSQNSADAAALAAGNDLYNNSVTPRFAEAVTAAKAFAAQNYGVTAAEWTACTDAAALRYQPAGTPCISFQSSGGSAQDLARPDRVRVLIPTRDLDTSLGQLAGVSSISIAAEAESGVEFDQQPPCGLCVIGPGPHDLQNGDVTVAGGNIHFNGSVSVSNNGLVSTGGSITVQNTASGPLSQYVPDPTTGVPPIADPLAFLAMPDITGLSVKTNPCGIGSTHGPGIYGSVDLRDSTCVLSPGLYVIAGSSSVWDLAGNASTNVIGSGVTLYFTCGTSSVPAACAVGQSGATIDASGNGTFHITAPTSGALQGLAIVYDRHNKATMRMTGNGAAGFIGTVYALAATIQMNGNGCSTYNSLIVVDTIEMNGSPTCLQSSFTSGANVEFPAGALHLTQ